MSILHLSLLLSRSYISCGARILHLESPKSLLKARSGLGPDQEWNNITPHLITPPTHEVDSLKVEVADLKHMMLSYPNLYSECAFIIPASLFGMHDPLPESAFVSLFFHCY